MSAAQRTPFYAEVHYYDGGLKTFSPGGTPRPDWVPTAEFVGFRDEFPLDHDDYAIEFRRVLVGTTRVSWIACYTRSVDRSLGDRGNYAGIGIWIAEHTLVYALQALKGLQQLCQLVISDDRTRLDSQVDGLLRNYLPTYVARIAGMPPGFAGVPFDGNSLCETGVFLSHGAEDQVFGAAAAAVVNASNASKPFTSASRLMMLLSQRKTLASEIQALSQVPDSFNLLAEMIYTSGEAWKSSEQMFVDAKNRVSLLESEVVQRDRKLASTEQQLNQRTNDVGTLQQRLQTTEGELSDLRNTPQARLDRELQEIKAAIRQIQHSLQQPSRTAPKSGSTFVPNPPAAAHASSSQPGNLTLVLVAVAAIFFGFVAGAGLLHWYENRPQPVSASDSNGQGAK